MISKNRAQALVNLIKNLNQLHDQIKKELFNEMRINEKDAIMNALLNQNASTRLIIHCLEDRNLINSDTDKTSTPAISINPITLEITVDTPANNSDILTMSTCCREDNTVQMSIGYIHDENILDLSMVEIKKGQIAEENHMSKNNKDIDIYTYSDPYTEDYTNHSTIKFKDIKQAIQQSYDNTCD